MKTKKTNKVAQGLMYSKTLEFETVSINTIYSIMINPNLQCDNELTRINVWLSKTLQLLSYFKHIQVYPEISRKGCLHYHGYVYFESYDEIIDLYLNMPNLLKQAIIEMDTYNGSEIYDNYCIKQKALHDRISAQTFVKIPIKLNYDVNLILISDLGNRIIKEDNDSL